MGSGTTALVARRLGRHYVGCDVNAEYVALANERLAVPYTLPMPLWRRAALSVTASVLAGYSTPAAMAILGSVHVLEGEGVHEKLQYPFAVGVGFLSHRILGPFLLRIAKKKADEVAP